MFFNSKKILGLDLGSSSIKMVELDVSRRGAALKSFGFTPTAPNSISGGEVLDSSLLGSTVRALLTELKVKRTHAATGMSGTSVIIKKVTMPRMEDKLLAEQIKWEAEQYIPFDINEINLEFQKLESANPLSDNVDVLLIAAKSDLIFKYVESVQLAGLQASILDVNSFALANCFEHNYGRIAGQVALLNIGATVTNFVVLESGQVTFTRDIPVGGLIFNHEIQNEMGVSSEEAESLKISASRSQPVPEDVHRVMASTVETISQEIHNSFDFYAASSNQATIAKFYVTGGCLSVPNILGQISRAVNVPGEVLDPFRNINVNNRKFAFDYVEQIKPFAAIAVGLGLRREGDQ